jgi:hypothetical protein
MAADGGDERSFRRTYGRHYSDSVTRSIHVTKEDLMSDALAKLFGLNRGCDCSRRGAALLVVAPTNEISRQLVDRANSR